MRSTGLICPMDHSGRLVIPKKLRRSLDLDTGGEVEIFISGNDIVLRKYPCNKTFMRNSEDSPELLL